MESPLKLILHTNESLDPVVSLVVPALNEQITIGLFIDWCLEGLKRANIPGEMLIIDSSTDETPIHFLKDRDGRVSHRKRMGWLSPWIACWQTLRAFFIYRPSFFEEA